jgi:RNA polymerase sigma factor (sigma-70 family)
MTAAAIEPASERTAEPNSDEQLMLRYGEGDGGAFDILYQRHRSRLFRFLQHQTGSRVIAEELYQDVWLDLIRARENYVVTARFSTFLLSIAHHRIADYFRDRLPHSMSERTEEEMEAIRQNDAPSGDPAKLVQDRQEIKRIDQALMQLSPEQRGDFSCSATKRMQPSKSSPR